MTLAKPKFRLAAKFSILVSLPVLVAAIILSYSFIKISKKGIDRGMIEKGEGLAKSLSSISEYGVLIEDRGILSRTIEKTIVGENVVHVSVRNKSGEILVSFGEAPQNMNYRPLDDPYLSQQEAKLNYRIAETPLLYSIACDILTVLERKNRDADIELLQLGDTSPEQNSQREENIGVVQVCISKSDMLKYIRMAKLGAIALTTVVTALAILATVLLVRAMVKPIKRLAVAAGMVSQGDLDYRVEAKTRDEIGNLAESFNRMIAHLRSSREENERYSKELEENARELSKSNEELNAFVYTVSHDLKAPVVSLQGFSSMLVSEYGDKLDEGGKMYIERINKNSERMGTLIENLLELSRVGRTEGQKELVSISDVISEVTGELAAQLKESGAKIIVMSDMPTLSCDRTRISQVFANLIGNANKFMGEDNKNPTIQVGYNSQNGGYQFYVRDNGIGIDKEYHEQIFRIFHRLDDIETEGTGVGLAIVKKIVENSGGRIWVNSAVEQGTTMYFTLPK